MAAWTHGGIRRSIICTGANTASVVCDWVGRARQGLMRASRAAVTELQALVQTAHNAGMVKLERTLEGLATTIEH